MATEMLAEARVQNPGMTRIPVAQPHYTATATYKDEALLEAGLALLGGCGEIFSDAPLLWRGNSNAPSC
ncbi:hypothetical protein AMK01_CH02798 [Rhizobium sp. N6212]|nr:hypothetical protein AMK01_CH02798 [Rhizobium sp. N6212]ANK98280.1 hypothetical protein AMK00_CH02801 [Rhizobium sp. N621]ANL04359.1 hypothetical protein AMJ99_CH02828 [Rhizobium esperanzae]ANL10472.1 hypothetical protein AMJ98_CH02829 [Rhizobium sp. N1341]ANL22525.1 hypothetical protein AMJ96_CH02832 [Rhizobium sp. N113]ANM35203.1 hypothetical protein AMK04_CH02831 [Rhizobium sp. N871]ANM41315.1 hypothetical protein AMK03_CH02831 [Rhizobium sp. N741]